MDWSPKGRAAWVPYMSHLNKTAAAVGFFFGPALDA